MRRLPFTVYLSESEMVDLTKKTGNPAISGSIRLAVKNFIENHTDKELE